MNKSRNQKFQCDMCGLCCRNVGKSEVYKVLDRGDGVCKYFVEVSNKCSIYQARPILCNIDAYYDKYLTQEMTRENFHDLNYAVCKKLKNMVQE